jgi:hypothetical protein
MNPTRILLAGLALGFNVDLLFWGKPPGVSVLLFVLLTLVALFWLGRVEDVRPAWRNVWLVGALLFFAAMVAVRAGPFLTLMNVSAVLCLLGLVCYYYAAGRVARLDILAYPITLLYSFGGALAHGASLITASVQTQAARRQRGPNVVPVLRGLLLALPVLLVFTPLLASADAVFAGYLAQLFTLNLAEFSARTSLVLASGWLLAGGLAYALSRRGGGEEEPWEQPLAEIPGNLPIGFIEAATVLVSVNLLFMAFGGVQFAYLFGGEANISAAGYTYAEYARRGFFELVTVAVLTLGLVLFLRWLTRRNGGRETQVFNLLGTLLVVLTLVLLASSFWRMRLYEEAYGYTHLRLYVHIFEIWLAVVFGWFVFTLWLKPRRFAIGAFAACLGFLATVNLINPDVFIAEENLARYRATGKIDVRYLAAMSDDAVPALVQALGTLSGEERAYLSARLKDRYFELERGVRREPWTSFNLSRQQAYAALAENREHLR